MYQNMRSGIAFLFISFFLLSEYQLIAQIATIHITTAEEILDEPKIPGIFTFTDTDGQSWSADIGIEIRGGFSQILPKKSYGIEFWSDPDRTETIDVTFGNLREDDDWILDALYNEPLRINSFITHKLWLELHELYYKELELSAKSGADVMYVEVTLNGVYQGIYMLSEEIDRKQLKLRKNDGLDIRGEMYKGIDSDDAVFFNKPDVSPNNASLTWSGFEYRYPDDVVDWSNVEELVLFVANSTDEVFAAQVAQRFDIENLMDYFILLNLPRILDNRGKNIFLCRYDSGEPYFLVPWDLDGSWGLLWNGNNDGVTEGALSNNLYDRLIQTNPDNFRQKLSDKWNAYRDGLLSDASLVERITETHQFLLDNGIYEKEATAWEYEYSENDLNYLLGWLEDRLIFLDDYFNKITSIEMVEDDNILELFPNPAVDFIAISGVEERDQELYIYNFQGELIRKQHLQHSDRVDVKDLSPGVYLLSIGTVRKVFMIQGR